MNHRNNHLWMYPVVCLILVLLMSFAGVDAQNTVDQPVAETQTGSQTNDIEWSHDANYVAVATLDGVKVYDANLQAVATLLDGATVYSLDWHPSSAQLAVTRRNMVEIYNWNAVMASFVLADSILFNEITFFVGWNADGTRLAVAEVVYQSQFQTGLEVAQLSIWDGTTFDALLTIPSTYSISLLLPYADTFEWSPNDPFLLAGVGNGLSVQSDGNLLSETAPIIYIIDTITGNRIQEIPIGTGPIGYSIGWQPGGSLIAVGGEPGTVLFDRITEQGVAAAGGNHFDVFAIDWSPDGRYLASEQSVFDTQDYSLVGTFWAINVTNVSWSPNGARILIAHSSGILTLQDPISLPSYEPPLPTPAGDSGDE